MKFLSAGNNKFLETELYFYGIFLGIKRLKFIAPFIPRMNKSMWGTFGYAMAFEPFKISFELLEESLLVRLAHG